MHAAQMRKAGTLNEGKQGGMDGKCPDKKNVDIKE